MGKGLQATRFDAETVERYDIERLRKAVAGARQTRGNAVMLRYLAGESIGRAEAMLAKCAECSCWHADGRMDCENPGCPLYPWRPYQDATA